MPFDSLLGRPVDFIILSTMRSGSNNLQDALNEHPEIECGGEVFSPGHIQIRGKVYKPGKRTAAGRLRMSGRVAIALSRFGKRRFPGIVLRIAPRARRGNIFGFRLFGDHIVYFGLEAWLKDRHAGGTRFIHLVRRNTFDQALSLVRAQSSGTWKMTSDTPVAAARADSAALADGVQAAMHMLHEHKVITARIARQCGAALLDYDEYTSDERSYDRIQEILGVRSRVALRHINTRTPPFDVEGYHQLREEMKRRGAPLRFDPEGVEPGI